MSTLADRVHEVLWSESLELVSLDAAELDSEVRSIVAALEPLAPDSLVEQVSAEVSARVNGLGPLYTCALDPLVSEIMVNGDGSVWVERDGRIEPTDQHLSSDSATNLVRRLAASAGRRIDRTSPAVDVRLEDGSRLHGILPPLAVDGPCLTIRRFAREPIPLDRMATPQAVELLTDAVRSRKTIVVAGGTGSGKTTMLNALGSKIDASDRIITIEDAAELKLPSPHVVRLETRRASEGVEAVGVRELVRNALRMRPDRLICGEMRGAEALDLVQAMNTGHQGSMSTVHANGSEDALRRIETMMLLGDAELPLVAVRDQIASCVDLIVMMGRTHEASREVVEICSVEPVDAPTPRIGAMLYRAPAVSR